MTVPRATIHEHKAGKRNLALTPEQLAELRQESVEQDYTLEDAAKHRVLDVYFTCDNCSHAPTCLYVFDMYNTGGDCLASK